MNRRDRAQRWIGTGPSPLRSDGARGSGSGCRGSSGGQAGLDRFNASEPIVWIDSLSALHAGVKASQGSFSLPFDGWLVRGGEARSIEAATVAGDVRQVLKAIVGFEGDAKVTPDGLCPLVWVEGLSITGEA